MRGVHSIFDAVVLYLVDRIENFSAPEVWPRRDADHELHFCTGTMALEGSDLEEPLHVVFGVGQEADIVPIVMTDGDPGEIRIIITNLLIQSADGAVFDKLHTVRLTDSPYLESHNVYGLIFLVPSTLNYFAEIEDCVFTGHERRKVLMMVFLNENEYRIAMKDRTELLEYFERIDRDLIALVPQSAPRD